MFGDIYPTKYMGKTTDMFRRLKFRLPVNLRFYCNTYAASREKQYRVINTTVVSDFMVDSMLKNIQRYFCGMNGMS